MSKQKNIPISECHYIEFDKFDSKQIPNLKIIHEDNVVFSPTDKNFEDRPPPVKTSEYQDAKFKKILQIDDGFIDYGSKNKYVVWSIYTKTHNIFYQNVDRIPIKNSKQIIKYDNLATAGLSFYPKEYGHYPFEILPRIIKLLEVTDMPILMYNTHYIFLKSVIDHFYPDRKIIIYDNSKIYFSKKLIFSSYFISKKDILLLQKKLNNLLPSENYQDKIILISRKDSNKRNINIKEIYTELEHHFPNNEIIIFVAKNYSREDTHKLFHSAKLVIGMHGAGLSNFIYCRPNTKVIEFITYNSSNDYQYFSDALDLHWYGIHINGSMHQPKLKVDITELRKKLYQVYKK